MICVCVCVCVCAEICLCTEEQGETRLLDLLIWSQVEKLLEIKQQQRPESSLLLLRLCVCVCACTVRARVFQSSDRLINLCVNYNKTSRYCRKLMF